MAVQPALKFITIQWAEQLPGTFSAEGPQPQAGYQYSWHTTTSVAASGIIQQRETFTENTEGNTSCHGAAAVTPRHPIIPKEFLRSLCSMRTRTPDRDLAHAWPQAGFVLQDRQACRAS